MDLFTYLTEPQTPSTVGERGQWVPVGQARSFVGRDAHELFRSKVVLFWSVAFPVAVSLLDVPVFVDTSTVPEVAVPSQKAVLRSVTGVPGDCGLTELRRPATGRGRRGRPVHAAPLAPARVEREPDHGVRRIRPPADATAGLCPLYCHGETGFPTRERSST